MMKERIPSTLNELIRLINEYSDKKLFFRGENKCHRETTCLPPGLRKPCPLIDINSVGDTADLWFTKKLEALGVGTPYNPPKDDSTIANITSALQNDPSCCWRIWGEEKTYALMTHYEPDFKALEDLLGKTDLELLGSPFISSYLNITSDIIVALHFACSQFDFKLKHEDISKDVKTLEDGYVFVFDLNGIENAEYVKLVLHPSYSYFYKDGNGQYRFQPFDRITHQRGAFLAPKRDKGGTIYREILEKEMQERYLHEKIILTSNLKQELFELFGGKKGLKYYFPKIPVLPPKNENVQQAYKKLKRITVLE